MWYWQFCRGLEKIGKVAVGEGENDSELEKAPDEGATTWVSAGCGHVRSQRLFQARFALVEKQIFSSRGNGRQK